MLAWAGRGERRREIGRGGGRGSDWRSPASAVWEACTTSASTIFGSSWSKILQQSLSKHKVPAWSSSHPPSTTASTAQNATTARKYLSLPAHPQKACEFGHAGMTGCAKCTVLKERLKQVDGQECRCEAQWNMDCRALGYSLSCSH